MVLPALSKPRRRTEYSVVERWSARSLGVSTQLALRTGVTFFAGRVRIQRLGQVIHDRKIKTDATEIIEPRESWEKKHVGAPEALETPRGVGVAICDAIPSLIAALGK